MPGVAPIISGYTLAQAQRDIAALRGQVAALQGIVNVLSVNVTNQFTAPDGSVWVPAGLTMTQPLAMGANKVAGIANGSNPQDAAAFGQLPSIAGLAPTASPTFTGTVTLPDGNTDNSSGWNAVGLVDRSAPSTPSGGSTAYSGSGQAKYKSSDGNAYNTGVLVLASAANNSSPQTINSTGATTVTGCSGATGANAYLVKVFANFIGGQAAGNPSFQISVSGSVSISWGNAIFWDTGTGTNRFDSNTSGMTFQGPVMSTNTWYVSIDAYVKLTSSGTITLQAFTSVGTDTYSIKNAVLVVNPIT